MIFWIFGAGIGYLVGGDVPAVVVGALIGLAVDMVVFGGVFAAIWRGMR